MRPILHLHRNRHRASAPGEYTVRILANGIQTSNKPMMFRVYGGTFQSGGRSRLLGYFEVPPDRPKAVEFRTRFEARRDTLKIVPYGSVPWHNAPLTSFLTGAPHPGTGGYRNTISVDIRLDLTRRIHVRNAMTIEEKLNAKHLALPEAPKQRGKLRPAIRVGNIVRTSGHTSTVTGKLGKEVTVDQGYDAARETLLKCLTSVKTVTGDLQKVKRIIHVLGLVNAGENFIQMPQVIHGATDLLLELWGEDAGWHTRSAIGVYQLPGNSAVEIELTVEIGD